MDYDIRQSAYLIALQVKIDRFVSCLLTRALDLQSVFVDPDPAVLPNADLDQVSAFKTL